MKETLVLIGAGTFPLVLLVAALVLDAWERRQGADKGRVAREIDETFHQVASWVQGRRSAAAKFGVLVLCLVGLLLTTVMFYGLGVALGGLVVLPSVLAGAAIADSLSLPLGVAVGVAIYLVGLGWGLFFLSSEA